MKYAPMSAVTAVMVGTLFLTSCRSEEVKSVSPSEHITISFARLPQVALAGIAFTEGFFKQQRLEVTPHMQAYGKAALEEVLSGKADFATVAETPVMFSVMNGEKIAIVATIHSSKRNEAVVARKDRGILMPGDLKGKRVATTTGTTSDFFMHAFLAAHGVRKKDVTLVDLKPMEMAQALATGEVDAVSAFVPYLTEIQKKLGAGGITFYDEDIYIETFNIVARQDLIRNRPETVRKLLLALLKAEEFVKRNPSQSQKLFAEFIGADYGSIRDGWPANNFSVTLEQSLLLALEDESSWAIKGGLAGTRKIPNYLDYIYLDGLKAVKPGAVKIFW